MQEKRMLKDNLMQNEEDIVIFLQNKRTSEKERLHSISLQKEDISNIINWLKRSQVDSQQIYDFLLKYGIDTEVLNSLINSGE